MLLRNAFGRTVSVLNENNDSPYINNDHQQRQIPTASRHCSSQREDTASIPVCLPPLQTSQHCSNQRARSSTQVSLPPLQTSGVWDVPPPPNNPGLLRSDSIDSQISCEMASPPTPSSALHDCSGVDDTASCQSPFYGYAPNDRCRPSRTGQDTKAHSAVSEKRRPSSSATTSKEPAVERKGKRYSCRYAEELSCDRTFTTSGHASRHAKIHFAMRTVPCTFENCTKMFTRSDNMKQHLETHYKRVDGGQRPSSGTGSGSDPRPRSRSRPASKRRWPSTSSNRLLSPEFELPMRPPRNRRLGSADSGASIASSALGSLMYATQQGNRET